MPLFMPGQIVATPGALAALDQMQVDPTTLLKRHCSGDFGDLSQSDVDANKNALTYGDRILSKYVVQQHSFYVITEHDRSYTTLMLTSDY